MTARIAVVEDDSISREMLLAYLGSVGYAADGYADAAALRANVAGRPPQLILLDLYMPGEDGLSVLRWLRSFSQVPVIMLTSADSTADRVIGLELGADDYLPKPFDTRELLARIRTVLRRQAPVAEAAPKAAPSAVPGSWFGRWRLDRERRRLVDEAGIELPITGQEYALLCVFAEHPCVVLSREKLLDLSGTDPAEVFDRAIDLRITRLRKKIEPVPGDPTVIRTVRGHGGGYEYVPGDGPNYGR